MKRIFIFVAIATVMSLPSFAQFSVGNYPSIPSTTSPYSSIPYTSVPSITVPTSVPSITVPTSVPDVRYQSGYSRSDGTYVNGHYKTRSNQTNYDNFSTQGNINVYTGTQGSRARDYSPGAYNYGVGQTIHTGSRGGQYYINSHGNKTYVPKRR